MSNTNIQPKSPGNIHGMSQAKVMKPGHVDSSEERQDGSQASKRFAKVKKLKQIKRLGAIKK